ncbi:hypothetical protein AALP_AA5G008600 [Arabis alpina]|uniref:Cyclin-like domain-containing protein n=1 Tax=Arabis alpina TaxID=50452 RepID=A0A087GU54_ARAAL|nr:hypothetical protein AALP_AA5G008600 [Arabis alpina]
MGKAKATSRIAKRKAEVKPFSGKKKAKSATLVTRRKKSPTLNHQISNDSVVSSSDCFLDVSSRVEKSSYSKKRPIDEVEVVDTIGDLKFRRITRLFTKLENEKKRDEIESSSVVESDSVCTNLNDEISVTKSDVTFAADHFSDCRNLNFEVESDVVSRVECGSSVTGGFGNEGIEISKPSSNSLEISNLTCTEQFSNQEVSDYFLDSSEYYSSEYTPSIFFDSGSEFSEKSVCDTTPSLTHSLFLEFKNQFRRSTIPKNLNPSFADDEHYEIRPELRSFEDEEVEESYQGLRERERVHAYLQGNGKAYYSGIDQSGLIPHLRLILVQWIVNECSMMEHQNETLFLSVSLLDRFLNKGSFRSQRSLLILGIACLTLATRIEENQIINTIQRRKFYIQDEKISRSEVVAMEWLVQEVLSFRCISPTVYNFLWFYLEAAKANPQVENKAKSLAIMALSDYSLLRYWPSTLAAAFVVLACRQNNDHEAYTRAIEVHVRTKDNNLPECVKSMDWLLGK